MELLQKVDGKPSDFFLIFKIIILEVDGRRNFWSLFSNLYHLVLNLKNKKRGNKNEKTLSFEKKHMSITSSTNVVFELMNFFNFRSSTDWFVILQFILPRS